MQQITIQEFISGYEQGIITEVVVIKDKVYGRSVKGQATNPQRYIVVYAVIL